jgi:hypothetical protein
LGVFGATRGIVALLIGFAVEALAVWLGLRGKGIARRWARGIAG